jgi:hypothetical protein
MRNLTNYTYALQNASSTPHNQSTQAQSRTTNTLYHITMSAGWHPRPWSFELHAEPQPFTIGDANIPATN